MMDAYSRDSLDWKYTVVDSEYCDTCYVIHPDGLGMWICTEQGNIAIDADNVLDFVSECRQVWINSVVFERQKGRGKKRMSPIVTPSTYKNTYFITDPYGRGMWIKSNKDFISISASEALEFFEEIEEVWNLWKNIRPHKGIKGERNFHPGECKNHKTLEDLEDWNMDFETNIVKKRRHQNAC